MNRYCIFLLSCVFACGCVTPSKYRDQQSLAASQQRRADALDKDLAAATKNLAAAQAALSAANDSIKKDADTAAGLNAQLKAGADQLAALHAEMASVQKSNQDLQQSLDAKKGELSKKISELIKGRDDLSQKLDVANTSLATAMARATAAEASLAVREKDLAQARDEKAALEKAKADEVAAVRQNFEALAASLKSEIAAGEVTITQLKGKLTVNMVDRVLFESGQAEVRADGRKVLEKVGKILGGVVDKVIRIEGHTDNVPISGGLKRKYETNWELSTARATAVARYLQDVAKVDPKRLAAAGYGEYRPIAPNDTPEQRAQNRRIEIVLVPRD